MSRTRAQHYMAAERVMESVKVAFKYCKRAYNLAEILQQVGPYGDHVEAALRELVREGQLYYNAQEKTWINYECYAKKVEIVVLDELRAEKEPAAAADIAERVNRPVGVVREALNTLAKDELAWEWNPDEWSALEPRSPSPHAGHMLRSESPDLFME